MYQSMVFYTNGSQVQSYKPYGLHVLFSASGSTGPDNFCSYTWLWQPVYYPISIGQVQVQNVLALAVNCNKINNKHSRNTTTTGKVFAMGPMFLQLALVFVSICKLAFLLLFCSLLYCFQKDTSFNLKKKNNNKLSGCFKAKIQKE